MKPLIVFFDGPCVLCNRWVQWLCRHDHSDRLRFANFEHPAYQDFALLRCLPSTAPDTVIVWDQEMNYYTQASAVFQLLKTLGGAWAIFALFRFLPTALTNGIYRVVANNRYRWFGQMDHCPLLPEEYKHKFL